MDYRYHVVDCENIKSAGYGEFDNVDFNLNFPGRSLICGSIRLEGEVQVFHDGATLQNGTRRVHCDHMIGAHSFVQSCVTTFQNQGVIENATELPRYAKMIACGTARDQDMNSAKYVCELRSPDKMIQTRVLTPRVPSDIGGGGVGTAVSQHQGSAFSQDATLGAEMALDPDFSMKPVIALNRVASPNVLLNYSSCGQIKLTFNLARNLQALYGEDYQAAGSYLLQNLEVCYTTIPEQPKQIPLTLRSSLCLKSNMNSNLSNHSAKIPAISDSMSASYIQLGREVSNFHNSTALEQPPNIRNMKFSFNDSTAQYISYELRNKLEIIEEGAESLGKSTHNNIRTDLLAANDSFISGISMNQPINLANQKFSVQIESEVDTTTPFLKFQYFSSLVSF